MLIRYIYHSGFVIETEGFNVLIDYFRDTKENPDGEGFVRSSLIPDEKPLYVLSSHFHPDHFNPEILKWKASKENITYLFSKDILKRKRAVEGDALFMKKGDVYEDDLLKIKAFGSTDVGISFLIEINGKLIFHAGDLNNWHWKDESTPMEVRKAEGDYLKELGMLVEAVPHLDLAMFPVDPRVGTDFAKGAEQLLTHIPVKHLIPMHFWERPSEVRSFEPYALSKGCAFHLLSIPGEFVELFS